MEEDKNELLDRYLAGESISDEQQVQVEQWLQQDPELRSKARFLLQMHDWGRQQRQEVLADQPQPSLFARPFAWAAAVSIALAISIGLWWYNQASDIIPVADNQLDNRGTTSGSIGSDIIPVAGNQAKLQKVAVYEKRDKELGFAESSQPADSTFLMPFQIHTGDTPEYRFATYDTLQVRMSAKMLAQQWHLVSINGFDYQLISNNSIVYPLELGRQLWLPLKAN